MRATKKEYVPATPRLRMTPGQMVRVARETHEMTQAELSKKTGIPQPAISAIESGRESLGVERAEKLAIALRVHPAVLVWPAWDATLARKRSA
ncbi:MAG: helix-turn-helix transcriptional regulator [Polyangiaceae bacterium]